MKKFFTLIAAVAMAASMNAQGTYAVSEGETVKAGDQITSVEGATLTFMEKSETTFAAGKKTTNWADADFTNYLVGKNNGKLVKGAEPTGCVYKIETTKAGSVTVGVQLSPNKGLHILDAEFNDVELSGYNLPDAADGESQKLTTNSKGETIIAEDGVKSNGTVTFAVADNGTYYVLAAGTKLGFFGFKYTVGGGTTGVSHLTAAPAAQDGATYNLAGQQVSSSYKGLVIKNGKKFINNK